MIRLTLLTLAALVAVLMIFGERGPDTPARPVAEAQPEPEPQAAPEPVAEEPVPVIEASAQTPQRQPQFPGPALRPSPEHQNETEAAETDLAAQPGATVLYVTGNRVNFRAGPSTSDLVVGALQAGSPVEALGPETGGWINIRDAQGRAGYMSAQFLSPNRP